MLTLTKNAVRRFKSMLKKQGLTGSKGVRIYTVAGCCGPKLTMDMADGPDKGDVIIEKDGVKVFLGKKANKLLSNLTLDYTAKEGIVIGGMPRSSCCG